ncbi:flagellar assembly protein FliH [Tolumonas lignilytica]|uniref:flagellar assembly protein FliH n=1 Tax=Tolumonas lignilytica TaxID=1283284 RepID=UPI0004634FB0|nr:flagellar assembly protein FliH [Tolumonas lignilytica]
MEPLDKLIIPGEQVPEADKWQLPEMIDPDEKLKGSNALGYEPNWYQEEELPTESSDVEEEQPPLTLEEIEAIRQAAYEDGFSEGKEAGFQQGYAEGMAKGELAGHADGVEKGREEGLELGREWIGVRAQQWQDLLDKLSHPLMQVDKMVEQQLVWLAMQLAKSLIKTDVHLAPDLILNSLKEGVKQLPAAEEGISIELHPEDLDMIKEIYGEEECRKRGWQLNAEPSLQRGDLVIASQTSSIDMFLEKRIEQLFRQFLRQNLDKTS